MSQAQYTDQIVRLIQQQGEQQAAAADRRGQIWGGALANIGRIPQDVQNVQRQKSRDALQQQELGLRTQQIGLEVDRSTQEKQDRESFDKILSDPSVYNPDHTINREFLMKAPIPGHLRPKFDDLAAHLDEQQTQIAEKRQKLADAQNDAVGRAMLKVEAAGNDPNAFGMAMTSLVASGAITPTQAKSYQARATDTNAVAAITKQLKAGTKSEEEDLAPVTEFGQYSKRTGKIVIPGTPKAPAAKGLQSENVLLDGKPAKVNFNPDNGKYLLPDGTDVSTRVKPIPPASATPQNSYQLVPEIDPKTGAQTGRYKSFNSKTSAWEVVRGEGPASTKAAPGAAAAATEERSKAEALNTLAQLDTAIDEAKDLIGPGAGRVSNVEQMLGSADPKIQALGVKMKAAKMRADHAITGSVRAGASPVLLQQWDNILANKVTHEGLKAGVKALREIVSGDTGAATVTKPKVNPFDPPKQ